jgi:hypothetical protein
MNTSEIRSRITEYINLGFTMKESFEAYRTARRVSAKRSGHKIAEIIGNNENRTYSILDKKFIYNK